MTTKATTPETIIVPEAPAIPGLSFRRFRGESDFPLIVAVFEAGKVADRVERSVTAQDVARFYAHLTNFDPYRDVLLVEVDGRVVGYFRMGWQREESGPWLYTHNGMLDPAWRGRGIGRAVLRFNEQHLRALAAEHPAGAERYFQTDLVDTQTAYEALLLNEGYTAVRHGFHMVRPLDEPITITPMPAGLEVRPAQPEHYRAVWEADVEAFRDHWGFVAPTEKNYQGWLVSPGFMPHLWQVGWDAATGEVAGMVLNFVREGENAEYQRWRGYTEGISVRRPWRRRGLARALLTRSLQMFKDMGMTEAALGVDTENLSGALRLYESVGFRVATKETVYRKAF